MVGETIEQCGCHLRIAEHAWPFAEGEIGRHDHRGPLVEAADQMEQQLPTGQSERQVTEFVDLCRAQHKSIHVESAVMWSRPILMPALLGGQRIRHQVTPHNHWHHSR